MDLIEEFSTMDIEWCVIYGQVLTCIFIISFFMFEEVICKSTFWSRKHHCPHFFLEFHQLKGIFVPFGIHLRIVSGFVPRFLFPVYHFMGDYFLKCIFSFFPVDLCRFDCYCLLRLNFLVLLNESILGLNLFLFVEDGFFAVDLLFIFDVLLFRKFACIHFCIIHKRLYFLFFL